MSSGGGYERDGWYFDSNNTFCISLETSVDRRERMKKRFDRFWMDVSFCRAATPEECHENFIEYLSPGQRACTQSHINVWRHIFDKQLPYALILEDDAMFDLQWREKMNDLWEQLRGKEWDAVFLNCSEPVFPLKKWVRADEQFLCGAYVVSLAGVRNMFYIMWSLFKDIVYMSDWTTSRLQEMGRCWTYYPWLVIQEGRESLIGSGVDLDHAKVVRCLDEIGYDISGNYV
jgi:GR25 family glycosyltransferase involved in LPS biosynthesis